MESEHFDTLTTRITAQLTRRRTLGILGAVAAVRLGQADEAGAKKKKKKKRKHHSSTKPTKPVPPPACTGCSACQTCVNGVCQALPENSACGVAGICIRGACSRACNPALPACPAGSTCTNRQGRSDGVCVSDSEIICFNQTCAMDSMCPPGAVCTRPTCIDLDAHCATAVAG